MTPQEAIEAIKIKEIEINGNALRLADFFQGIGVATQALEKQIPKKTTEEEINRGIDISGEYDIDFHLCCPACGAVVGTYEAGVNEYFENYCSNCGQAIDVNYSGSEEGAEE